MTSITSSSIRYPQPTIERTARAVRCSPFQRSLFEAMISQSVALGAIAGEPGVRQHYTSRPLSELGAEAELLWLIQVGLLRREVDGQGLTDSFRLTPLGRQLVQTWQTEGCSDLRPSWRDRFYNSWSRWLRLPV
jgi:hypothetical protein